MCKSQKTLTNKSKHPLCSSIIWTSLQQFNAPRRNRKHLSSLKQAKRQSISLPQPDNYWVHSQLQILMVIRTWKTNFYGCYHVYSDRPRRDQKHWEGGKLITQNSEKVRHPHILQKESATCFFTKSGILNNQFYEVLKSRLTVMIEIISMYPFVEKVGNRNHRFLKMKALWRSRQGYFPIGIMQYTIPGVKAFEK